MADLKISELSALAGGNLAAADQLAIADSSASETKRITVTDLVGNATTLIADATIPGAKILFGTGDVGTTAIADGSVTDAKLAADSVTADKIADEVIVDLVTTLPASGAFVGQLALDTTDSTGYIWNGSSWVSFKAAGSVNAVVGDTSGIVNLNVSTVGDQVTITTTLDDTTAARQFLAGPTGAGGTVGYRQIVSGDIPTASTSKGGVAVNGNGLVMSGDTIQIDNTVVAETTEHHLVQYDANGLVTGGRVINAGDIPVATNTTVGTVKPGSGLGVDGTGDLSHSNAVVAGTATKFTFDTEGHVTATESLLDTDIPDLDAAKITTGEFPTARIANAGITAEKLANYSTASIAELTPASGDFIGQTHLNSITGDYFLWDGNVWQPIGISVGEIVLAGTYDASTNLIDTVTSEGTALGFTVGQGLPAPSNANSGYYVIVSLAGTGSPPAPTVQLNPPDFLLSNGSVWTEIDVSDTVVAQQAQNVAFTPAGDIQSTNVQGAIEELDTEKAPIASPVFTGNVTLDTAGTLIFEGATDNEFETTLTVADPTADRTLTLPNVSGNIVTTGDTGTVSSTMIVNGTIVDADVSATADIAVDKLAPGTARQLLQTNVAGNGVQFTSNVDVPGTLDVTGATTLDSSLTVTGLISADGNISFPAGTAALPSIYFSTDTNTGLYQSAADEVSISTAGTQRVVVNSTGNVGIGTSSPAYDLDVSGPADNTYVRVRAGSSDTHVAGIIFGDLNSTAPGYFNYNNVNDSLAVGVNGAERMRITSAGRVGIGTSNPASELHVASASPYIRIEDEDGTDTYGEVGFSGTSLNLISRNGTSNGTIRFLGDDGTSTTERMRITSAGRVGIGTSNPAKDLHISSASGGIRLQDSDLTNTFSDIFQSGTALYLDTRADTNTGQTIFRQWNGTTQSEVMRIDSAGQVGIGTSSPGAKLHVDGGDQILKSAYVASGDEDVNLYLSCRSSGNWRNASIALNGLSEFVFSSGGIGTDPTSVGTERMRIDSAGNVGVGTSNPGAKLDISSSTNWNFPQAFLRRDASNIANDIKMIAFGLQADSVSETTSQWASFIGLNTDTAPTTGDTVLSQNAKLNLTSPGGVIMPVGNVGIGTSSPTGIFEIGPSNSVQNINYGDGTGTSYFRTTTDVNRAGAGQAIHLQDFKWNGTNVARIGAYTGSDTTNKDDGYLTFETSGANSSSERMRIDSAGNVGIGTSVPASKLHLADTSTVITFEDTNSTNNSTNTIDNYEGTMILHVDPNDNSITSESLRFSMRGTEAMRIDSAGNVGIGTSVPARVLTVESTNGFTQLAKSSTNFSYQTFQDSTSSTNTQTRVGCIGDDLSLWAGNGQRMRITSAGNVGIGTDNPGQLLHLASSDPRLNIEDTDSTSIFQLRNTSGAGYLQVLGSSSMIFSTDSAERMRISGAGNVGIGTSSPDTRLHVVATSNSETDYPLTIQNAADSLNTGYGAYGISQPAGSLYRIDASSSLAFDTNNSERMRIDSAGNVGIGEASPAATLDVNGAYASNITAVAALDLDLSTANYFTKTIAANSTFTFSSPAASRAVSFTLELTHTSGTVTWPTSVKWPGDVAPTLTTGKTHLFMFVTDDGGTTYRGASLVDYTN